jgi:preprotein translocase subunit YajC
MNSFLFPLLLGAPQTDGAGASGGGLMAFLPLIAIFAIFYFLIIRPQSKKQKDTQKMLAALKKGDRIITIGGIHGVIQTIRESTVIVRVDESTKLEFSRSAISGVESQGREDREDKKSDEKKLEAPSEKGEGSGEEKDGEK